MQTTRTVVGMIALTVWTAAVALGQDRAGDEPQEGGRNTEPAKPSASAAIGKPAPVFELKDSTGKTFKLADHKDNVVVLEWYSHACPVCKAAMPKMKELNKTYSGKGVIWVGIDSSAAHNAEGVEKARKDNSVDYPILLDAEGTVGHAYGAQTTPHMFIINKGTLVYAGAHDDKKGRNYVAESLDALLAGKAVPLAETKPYGCSVKYKK
jgi:peroxiredoxin